MRRKQYFMCFCLIVIVLSASAPLPAYAEDSNFSIGDYYCSLNPTGITILMYSGEYGDEPFIVPSELNGTPVTELGYTAFMQASIEEAVIPESVTKIGDHAFWACENLKSVTILSSDAEIEMNPFCICPKLERFVVSPDNPVYATIDGVLFNKVEKKLICYPAGRPDESYEIPQGIEIIGQGAFHGSQLKEIKIPDSVRCFEEQVFNSCSLLEMVNLPDKLTNIKSNPFYNCNSQLKVVLSEKNPVLSFDGQFLTDTDTNTLISCFYAKKDEPLIIPDQIEEISSLSCAQMPMIAIQFPDGLQRIKSSAFSHCENLESVTIPNSVTEIEPSVFRDCDSLKEAFLPDSLKAIGSYAFANCPSLEKVLIPPSVEEIDMSSFYYDDQVKLFVTAGSYAEQYARERDIQFESTVVEDNSWLD